MTLEISDHALRYASHNWCVLPVVGKRPTLTDWPSLASSEPATVARLFARNTHDGVGVLLGERSGVVDFDCDSPEAEATLSKLFDGSIPKTPSWQSTRGKHYLFRWTDRLSVGVVKLVVDGLEIRLGDPVKGAQTVLPPSGGRNWIVDPDDCQLADVPPLVIERILARHAEQQQPKAIAPRPYSAPCTVRGDDSLNVPKWLAKHGYDVIQTTAGTDGVTRYHIRCPGFAHHTTQNSWRDCCVTQDQSGKLGGGCFHSSCGMRDWQSLQAAIGPLTYEDFHEPVDTSSVDISAIASAPVAEDSIAAVAKHVPDQPNLPPRLPDSIFQVPGLIGDMQRYHIDNAPRPQPALSFLATVSLMGVLAGRKIETISGLRTNIYCIGLAESGNGKDSPRQENVRALTQAGCHQYLGAEDAASDTALIDELDEHPARLMQIDEVNRYFPILKNGADQNLAKVKKKYLELVGAAENPAWIPKCWSNSRQGGKKRGAIAFPHLCIFGVGTIDGFWDSVTRQEAEDGFLARLMVMESLDQPRLRIIERKPIPESVISIIQEWNKFVPPGGDLSGQFPRAMQVQFIDGAGERIRSHCDAIEDRAAQDGIARPIWRRCSVLAQRLSLIFAASRGPEGIQIKREDAERGVALANWCTRLMVSRIFSDIADNEDDKRKKKVLQIIRKAGSMTANELARKTQWLKDRFQRASVLQELLDAEWITMQKIESGDAGGRSLIVYSVA